MNTLILRIGLALAIGLLVGLERGWRERDAPSGSRTAGIRTYGISGLFGGIVAALAEALGAPSVFAVTFLGFALVFAAFKMREARNDAEYSVTGVIAGLAVFGLGGLAVSGDYRAAAAGGAALAATLASRDLLHGLLKKLSWVELRSALALAVMTAIGLPLLPNRAIDPWGGLNPWEIWLFTVLTAAISYVGYVAVRVLGTERGLLVSGLAGAMISSTAVTVAFARSAAIQPTGWKFAGAAALAAMISILRVVVIVTVVAPAVLPTVIPVALTAVGVFAACGFVFLIRGAPVDVQDAPSRNPFDFATLLGFALLLAVVSVAGAVLVERVGSRSLVATAGVSGMFDVDAAVLGALRLTGVMVSAQTVGQAVLAALAVNAVGRLGLAVVTGPVRYWLPLALASALALSAGAGVYAVVH